MKGDGGVVWGMHDPRGTLELESAADGWVKADHADGTEYVAYVKVAGCEVSPSYGKVTIECQEWSIEKGRKPALLIEAPEWYTRPDSD